MSALDTAARRDASVVRPATGDSPIDARCLTGDRKRDKMIKRYRAKTRLVRTISEWYVAQAVAEFARGRVLDVGCGQRPYEPLFRRGGVTYIGLEHPGSRNAPKQAEIHGDGLALPARTSSCDTVVSFQVLEHVREPWVMVAEIARVLRPGGHLILTAPHIWGLHEEPEDYFRFTKYGLRHLCERAGLEVVSVRAMAGYWVTEAQRFCSYLEHFDRFAPVRPLLPVAWAAVQALGRGLDRLHRVESETWNYIIVARKPARRSA